MPLLRSLNHLSLKSVNIAQFSSTTEHLKLNLQKQQRLLVLTQKLYCKVILIWYSRENQFSVIKQDYLFNVTSFETKVLSSFNVAAKKEVELFVDHMFIVCKDIRMQPVSDQVDQCSHQFPAIKNSARNNNVSIHRWYFLSLARSFSFNERQKTKN